MNNQKEIYGPREMYGPMPDKLRLAAARRKKAAEEAKKKETALKMAEKREKEKDTPKKPEQKKDVNKTGIIIPQNRESSAVSKKKETSDEKKTSGKKEIVGLNDAVARYAGFNNTNVYNDWIRLKSAGKEKESAGKGQAKTDSFSRLEKAVGGKVAKVTAAITADDEERLSAIDTTDFNAVEMSALNIMQQKAKRLKENEKEAERERQLKKKSSAATKQAEYEYFTAAKKAEEEGEKFENEKKRYIDNRVSALKQIKPEEYTYSALDFGDNDKYLTPIYAEMEASALKAAYTDDELEIIRKNTGKKIDKLEHERLIQLDKAGRYRAAAMRAAGARAGYDTYEEQKKEINEKADNAIAELNGVYALIKSAKNMKWGEKAEELRQKPDWVEKSKASEDGETNFSSDAVDRLFAEGSVYGAGAFYHDGFKMAAARSLGIKAENVEYYQFCNEYEKETIRYLIRSGDSEGAEKYFNAIESDVLKRRADKYREEDAEFAEKHPILSSVGTVVTSPIRGVAGLQAQTDDLGRMIFDKDYEPRDMNQPINDMMHYSDTVRSTVKEDMGAAGQFCYDVVMSMGDNAMNILSTGGQSALTLALMDGDVYNSSYNEAIQNGANGGQAFAYGFTKGMIEVATEKVPLDEIISVGKSAAKTGGKIGAETIKRIAKQGGIEGSEEVIANLLGYVADGAIMGENSEYNRSVKSYMASGLTREEAERNAVRDRFIETVMAGAAGMVSGMGMGTAAEAGGRAVGAVKGIGNRNGSNTNVGNTEAENAAPIPQSTAETAAPIQQSTPGANASSEVENAAPSQQGSETVQNETPEKIGVIYKEGTIERTRDIALNEIAKVEVWNETAEKKAERNIEDLLSMAEKAALPEQAELLRTAAEDIQTAADARSDEGRAIAPIQREAAEDVSVQAEDRQSIAQTAEEKEPEASFSELSADEKFSRLRPEANIVTLEELEQRYKNEARQVIKDAVRNTDEDGEVTAEGSDGRSKRSYKEALEKNNKRIYTVKLLQEFKNRGINVTMFETADEMKGTAPNGLLIDGKIFININSENPIRQTLGHEMLHLLKQSDGEAYNRVLKIAKESIGKNAEKSGRSLEADMEAYADRYGQAYGKWNEDMYWEEKIADIAGDLSENTVFGKSIIEEAQRSGDKSILQRVADAIGRMIARLKGVKSGEAVQWVGNARKLHVELVKAYRNMLKSETEGNEISSDISYSLQKNAKGKYVQADRQVIKGDNPDEWVGQIYNYINDKIRNGKDVIIPTDDGDKLTITEKTAWKMGYRNRIDTRDGQKQPLSDSLYRTKLNAAAHIDELAQISKRGKKNSTDRKNHNFAQNGFNYRTAYFKDLDGSYYRMMISVGENSEQKTVYNIGTIDKVPFPDLSAQRQGSTKAPSAKRHFTDNISDGRKIVKGDSNTNDDNRYSLPKNRVEDVGRDAESAEQKAESVIQSQQFKDWFGDWENNPGEASKVVDEDGKPKVVYHQTNSEFNTFDTKKEAAGQYDDETPTGIFMKTTPDRIALQGNLQMGLYANIRNPLQLANRAEARRYYSKNIKGYAELLQEIKNNEAEYKKKLEEYEKQSDEWYRENYNKIKSGSMTEDELTQYDNFDNMEEELTREWQKQEKDLSRKAKELVNEYFRNSDYDGVYMNDDNGVETYIAFSPSQVKSATDNIGTFDPNNADIRYSMPKGGAGRSKDKYWHTDLSKSQLDILQKKIDNDVKTSRNRVTDKANWISTYIGDTKVFAIYSTDDTEHPTILYEAKGNRADVEETALKIALEMEKNGERLYGKSNFANRVLNGDWVFGDNGIAYSAEALERGGGNRNAGVLQGQPRREPTRAFKRVIENLLEVQRRDREGRGRERGEVQSRDRGVRGDGGDDGTVKYSLSRGAEDIGRDVEAEDLAYEAEKKIKSSIGIKTVSENVKSALNEAARAKISGDSEAYNSAVERLSNKLKKDVPRDKSLTSEQEAFDEYIKSSKKTLVTKETRQDMTAGEVTGIFGVGKWSSHEGIGVDVIYDEMKQLGIPLREADAVQDRLLAIKRMSDSVKKRKNEGTPIYNVKEIRKIVSNVLEGIEPYTESAIPKRSETSEASNPTLTELKAREVWSRRDMDAAEALRREYIEAGSEAMRHGDVKAQREAESRQREIEELTERKMRNRFKEKDEFGIVGDFSMLTRSEEAEARAKIQESKKWADEASAYVRKNGMSRELVQAAHSLAEGKISNEEIDGRFRNAGEREKIRELAGIYKKIGLTMKEQKAINRSAFKNLEDILMRYSSAMHDTWVMHGQIDTPERVFGHICGKGSIKAAAKAVAKKLSVEDIELRKTFDKLKETFLDPIAENEAARAEFENKYREIVKDLGIKMGSEESAYVQAYGEGFINENDLINEFHLTEEERDKVINAANVISGIYKEILPEINHRRFAQGLEDFTPPQKGITPEQRANLARRGKTEVDYFPHISEEADDQSKILQELGMHRSIDKLSTAINGKTEDFKPNQKWSQFLQGRTGNKTAFDAIGGFDKYITSISNYIYHTSDITKIRMLENYIREKYNQQNAEKFALSNFVDYLRQYGDMLAGKQHIIDRAIQRTVAGRRVAQWERIILNQASKNQISGNIGTAITNLGAAGQTMQYAVNKCIYAATEGDFKVTGEAFKRAWSGNRKEYIRKSTFLTNRFQDTVDLPGGFAKQVIDKVNNLGYKPADIFDKAGMVFSHRLLVTTYMNEGLSEKAAIEKADGELRRIAGSRSYGEQPLLFNSKALGLLTKYQLEPLNQFRYMTKDTVDRVIESAIKHGDKAAWTALLPFAAEAALMMLSIFWMNKGFEKLKGVPVFLDPWQMGTDIVEGWVNGDGVLDILSDVAEEIPIVNNIQKAANGEVSDIVGIGAVVNVIGTIATAITNVGKEDEEKEAVDWVSFFWNTAMLLNPLGGAGQARKMSQAWSLLFGKGYSENSSGKVRYAIDKNNAWNWIMGTLFGKSAMPEVQEWWGRNYGTLSKHASDTFRTLFDNYDLEPTEAFDMLKAYDDLCKADDEYTPYDFVTEELDKYGEFNVYDKYYIWNTLSAREVKTPEELETPEKKIAEVFIGSGDKSLLIKSIGESFSVDNKNTKTKYYLNKEQEEELQSEYERLLFKYISQYMFSKEELNDEGWREAITTESKRAMDEAEKMIIENGNYESSIETEKEKFDAYAEVAAKETWSLEEKFWTYIRLTEKDYLGIERDTSLTDAQRVMAETFLQEGDTSLLPTEKKDKFTSDKKEYHLNEEQQKKFQQYYLEAYYDALEPYADAPYDTRVGVIEKIKSNSKISATAVAKSKLMAEYPDLEYVEKE